MNVIPIPVFFDGAGDMLEVNGLCLFDLGNINQLFMLPEGLNANSYKINEAIFYLETFVNAKQNQTNMPDSVEFGRKIIIILNLFRDAKDKTMTIKMKEHIEYLLHNFRTILSSELGKLTIILLEEKRGYSVQTLWKHPINLISRGVSNHLSRFVKSNLIEAAKCLVLNCHTAVGFHAMRSMEHVIEKYYELIIGTLPKYQNGNPMGLGKMVEELIKRNEVLKKQKQGSDDLVTITSNIKGFCKKRRNPLAHPEIISLKEDEAMETFVDTLQIINKIIVDAKAKGSHFVHHWKKGILF
jgi:hypothetical protein